MILYFPLCSRSGVLFLRTWQEKLHITVEVREVYLDGRQIKTARFGDSISVGNSPQAIGASNNISNDSDWRNKTYKDRDFMEKYTNEYRNKYQVAFNLRNCSRLSPDIFRLLDHRKHQRTLEEDENQIENQADTRNYLSVIDRNSTVDVAPHLTAFNNLTDFEKEDIFIEELRKRKEFYMVVATPNNKLSHWLRFPTGYS